MQKIKSFLRTETFFECILITFISAIVYLVFVPRFGYFNDDWYLMYAAGAKGPPVFWDIFAIDRPLRALVMIPAYTLFGPNPLYYNLSAFLFRLLSGFSFLWILRMIWPEKKQLTLWMSLLFLLYPGFLSQPNAIDYLCHQTGLAAGMISIGLTILATQANSWTRKIWFYGVSILLGWFCLGQIEWYIGLEFFRFACILLLAFRLNETLWGKAVAFIRYSLPAFLIPGVFLTWRLFFFESERGATDVNLQLGDIRGELLKFLFNFLAALADDFMDVLVNAWWLPLRRLSEGFTVQNWMPGFGLALLVLLSLWIFSRVAQRHGDVESGQHSGWRREVVLIGVGAIILGLSRVTRGGRPGDQKLFKIHIDRICWRGIVVAAAVKLYFQFAAAEFSFWNVDRFCVVDPLFQWIYQSPRDGSHTQFLVAGELAHSTDRSQRHAGHSLRRGRRRGLLHLGPCQPSLLS